jgi:hypothetical protein
MLTTLHLEIRPEDGAEAWMQAATAPAPIWNKPELRNLQSVLLPRRQRIG